MEVSLMQMRAFLIVLDSVGIGAAPDAALYGDTGSSTLGHLAEAVGGVKLPVFEKLGLGNIPGMIPAGVPIKGVPASPAPVASFGAMEEMSEGKDTTTGHWEMAGLVLKKGFTLFPHDFPSFPAEITDELIRRTGRNIIGNKAASGTAIIAELGAQQLKEGSWIIYTSGDSVLQIAAHEDFIPLQELYKGCEIARELCNPYRVGRVIARPYVGKPGAFKRTENRRDFSYPLPEPTILSLLSEAGFETITVGKLNDIFDNKGITRSLHVENNPDAQADLMKLVTGEFTGFVFANLIDFDMLYGHRRDPRGYADALIATDRFLAEFIPCLRDDDVMMITADHGNDPTFKGTDHTREFVPLLVYRKGQPAMPLGIRKGFYDIAQSLASFFGIKPVPRGTSFL